MKHRESFVSLLFLGASIISAQTKRPNFIICQPDDLRFFEEWTPPPHFPIFSEAQIEIYPENTGLPNIDRLRRNGIQMMQAYTASPMCGTSRYSTLTGRYPSRSAVNRWRNQDEDIARVKIPNTKLLDVNARNISHGKDCSENNLAVVLKKHGYRTGVTGKWHLGDDNDIYNYKDFQNHVRSCGFDYAESLYARNMWSDWVETVPPFSHNMEYMTEKAIEFIQQDNNEDSPFFLYFNPTVPHESGNVLEALTNYTCRQTCEGTLSREPKVKGMTDQSTCKKYRQTVIERADGTTDNNHVGSIWVDDAIGALLTALEDSNQLENTFLLFQMDHGQEGKTTLWEPGIRVAQFLHYPNSAYTPNTQFHGMVSTIDIAPIILDYARIDASKEYEMDGMSWKFAVEENVDETSWNTGRCLFHEIEYDRSVRCGCYKYIVMDEDETTYDWGKYYFGLDADTEVLYNLCTDKGFYDVTKNAETNDIKVKDPSKVSELKDKLQCHLEKTRANRETMDFSTSCNPHYDQEIDDGVNDAFTICFSGDTTVEVKERGVVKMKDLQVGDQVLVENNKNINIYETVFSFGHHDDNTMGSYLQLLPSKLELSSDHMVYVRGNREPIPASMIQVGNILSDGTRVDSIVSSIRRKGAYAPFTASGNLLVNGVLVSNYIAFQSSSTLIIGKSWKTPFTFQWLAHAFNTPHRLWWRLHCSPNSIFLNRICNDGNNNISDQGTLTGISKWVDLPLRVTHWLLKQSVVIQIMLLIPIIVAFSFLTVIETAFKLITNESIFISLFLGYIGITIILICKFYSSLKLSSKKMK